MCCDWKRVRYHMNRFLLFTFSIRCGFCKHRTICVAEILYYLWCTADFVLSALCLTHINKGGKLLFGIHSGILTGIFYFMTILLSLRYPFYWNWLVMMSFDRQMVYHQYCAWMAIICCAFHIIDNNDTQFITWKNNTGWFTWGSSVLMVVFASSWFRRKFYNSIFWWSHLVFLASFVVFSLLHSAIFVPYGLAAISMDLVLRAYDNAFKSVEITNIRVVDDDRVIVIEFKKRNFKYEAGQYVFMRVGKIGFFEYHPFSMSSHSDQDTVAIHIKVNVGGRWTKALCKLIKDTEKRERKKAAKQRKKGKTDTINADEWFKKIPIQIEGPHGYLTLRKPIHEYQHVIFIGGGIGITPLHSMFNQLISDLSKPENQFKNANVKHIEFIFTTRSKAMITEFARKNKAWDMLDDIENEQQTPVSPVTADDLDVDDLLNFDTKRGQKIADMTDISNLDQEEKEIYLEEKAEDIKVSMMFLEGDNKSTKFRNSLYGKEQRDLPKKNMTLKQDDILDNRSSTIIFERNGNGKNKTDEVEESITQIEEKRKSTLHSLQQMAVSKFDIKNSTHITVVKDGTLRMFYKTAYPFIRFKRPCIRSILYKAASISPTTQIVVLTSGPKTMIADCRKWSDEIGINVHFEIFDW